MRHAPVAVVTGGSRGIGRGIVRELAARGYRLVIHYRSDFAAAEEVRREALELGSPDLLTVPADLGDIQQGRALVEQVFERFGQVHLWVNNAGVAPATRADLLDLEPESWDRVLGVNLRGPFFLTQEVARRMVATCGEGDDPRSRPRIVFITSVSSTFSSVNRGEYCVSKAGLSMVVQLFASRLAESGIRVYEIRPGIIATDMTGPVLAQYQERIDAGLTPIRRYGQPEDVGRAVAALTDGAFDFSTGEVIHVDGGLHMQRL